MSRGGILCTVLVLICGLSFAHAASLPQGDFVLSSLREKIRPRVKLICNDETREEIDEDTLDGLEAIEKVMKIFLGVMGLDSLQTSIREDGHVEVILSEALKGKGFGKIFLDQVEVENPYIIRFEGDALDYWTSSGFSPISRHKEPILVAYLFSLTFDGDRWLFEWRIYPLPLDLVEEPGKQIPMSEEIRWEVDEQEECYVRIWHHMKHSSEKS